MFTVTELDEWKNNKDRIKIKIKLLSDKRKADVCLNSKTMQMQNKVSHLIRRQLKPKLKIVKTTATMAEAL
jgi:hypothetical protein